MSQNFEKKEVKAQIINNFGPANEVFTLINLPYPKLLPGYVLIEVHATSVNQIDCKIRSGAVTNIAPDLPCILHSDVSGIVLAVSEGVSEFAVGDEVYGCAGGLKGTISGALTTVMSADVTLIAHKPKSIDMRTAAALPLVGITAYTALVQKLNLKKDETILIHGGAGGVGHIALQIAKSIGALAYVTVGSQEDANFAKSLGASDFANFREESVDNYIERLTESKGFDAIFDTVGGANLENSFKGVALNGKIATTAARTTQDLSLLHNKGADLYIVFMLIPLIYNFNRFGHSKILKKLAIMVDAGKIMPQIDPHTFNLSEVSLAHELLESGQAKGKVVISVK